MIWELPPRLVSLEEAEEICNEAKEVLRRRVMPGGLLWGRLWRSVGGACGDRTRDSLLKRQVLYH